MHIVGNFLKSKFKYKSENLFINEAPGDVFFFLFVIEQVYETLRRDTMDINR